MSKINEFIIFISSTFQHATDVVLDDKVYSITSQWIVVKCIPSLSMASNTLTAGKIILRSIAVIQIDPVCAHV